MEAFFSRALRSVSPEPRPPSHIARAYAPKHMAWLGFGLIVALPVLLFPSASYCAEKTIVFQDAGYCRHVVRFDPTKYDEETLQNTFDVIFMDGFFESIYPNVSIDPDALPRLDPKEFQALCGQTRDRLRELSVVQIPGIEDYRKLSSEQLEDTCAFGAILVRAALGEHAALREYEPSVKQCSSFIDAVEGKRDMLATWRDLVETSCRDNSRPDKCRADGLSLGDKPNASGWIRLKLLTFGWWNCSAPFFKKNETRKRTTALVRLVEKGFRQRFKVKSYTPCDN